MLIHNQRDFIMIIKKCFSVLMLFSATVLAEYPNLGESIFDSDRFSGSINIGTLSGQTKERVYDPDENGRKVSQLNWKYSNAAIVRGELDWNLIPNLSLGAAAWSTIASKSGNMGDYDWLKSSQTKWTDYSRHPDTHLNYANEFDLNVKTWILKDKDYRAGILAGYKENRYSFNAKGGTYSYDNGADIGHFQDKMVVIGYKQRYKIPYVGLLGCYRYKQFEAEADFKYSGWVKTSDNDEHYLKKTTYRAKINKQKYYSLTGGIGYYLSDNAKVYVDGTWSRANNKKGDLSAYDYSDNSTESESNGAGIENYNFISTMGLKYIF